MDDMDDVVAQAADELLGTGPSKSNKSKRQISDSDESDDGGERIATPGGGQSSDDQDDPNRATASPLDRIMTSSSGKKSQRQIDREIREEAERIRLKNIEADRKFLAEQRRKAEADAAKQKGDINGRDSDDSSREPSPQPPPENTSIADAPASPRSDSSASPPPPKVNNAPSRSPSPPPPNRSRSSSPAQEAPPKKRALSSPSKSPSPNRTADSNKEAASNNAEADEVKDNEEKALESKDSVRHINIRLRRLMKSELVRWTGMDDPPVHIPTKPWPPPANDGNEDEKKGEEASDSESNNKDKDSDGITMQSEPAKPQKRVLVDIALPFMQDSSTTAKKAEEEKQRKAKEAAEQKKAKEQQQAGNKESGNSSEKPSGEEKSSKMADDHTELSSMEREELAYQKEKERMAMIEAMKRRPVQKETSVRQLINERSRPKAERKQYVESVYATEKCYFCERKYDPDENGLDEGALYCSVRCRERIVDKAWKVIKEEATNVMVVEQRTSVCLSGPSAPLLKELREWITENPQFYPVIPDVIEQPKPKPQIKKPEPTIVQKRKEQVKETTSDPNQIRLNIRRTLYDKFTAELQENPELAVLDDEVRDLCIWVEEAMFDAHNGIVTSAKYKNWFKAFLKSMRENKELCHQVLVKDVIPDDLVLLTPAQLLNKQEEEPGTSEPEKKKFEKKNPAPVTGGLDLLDTIMSGAADTTAQHKSHLFDQNCKICAGKQKKKAVALTQKQKDELQRKKELKRKVDEEMAERKRQKLESMRAAARARDAFVPPPPPPKPKVKRPSTPPPVAAADNDYGGGGADDNDDWGGMEGVEHSPPSTSSFNQPPPRVPFGTKELVVVGRMSPSVVIDYLRTMFTSSKDIILFSVDCNQDAESSVHQKLIKGMVDKERFSIIGNMDETVIKDLYLIPRLKNKPLPDVLLPFDDSELDKKDALLALVVPAGPKDALEAAKAAKAKAELQTEMKKEDGKKDKKKKKIKKEIKEEGGPKIRKEIRELLDMIDKCDDPSIVAAKVQEFLEKSGIQFTPHEETTVLGCLNKKIENAADGDGTSGNEKKPSTSAGGSREDGMDKKEVEEGFDQLKSLLESHVADGGSIPDNLTPEFIQSLIAKYQNVDEQQQAKQQQPEGGKSQGEHPAQQDMDMDLEDGEIGAQTAGNNYNIDNGNSEDMWTDDSPLGGGPGGENNGGQLLPPPPPPPMDTHYPPPPPPPHFGADMKGGMNQGGGMGGGDMWGGMGGPPMPPNMDAPPCPPPMPPPNMDGPPCPPLGGGRFPPPHRGNFPPPRPPHFPNQQRRW